MTMLFCLSRYFLDLESADQYGLFSKDGLLFTLHLYSWYLNPLNQLDIQIHNNKLNEYPVQMQLFVLIRSWALIKVFFKDFLKSSLSS